MLISYIYIIIIFCERCVSLLLRQVHFSTAKRVVHKIIQLISIYQCEVMYTNNCNYLNISKINRLYLYLHCKGVCLYAKWKLNYWTFYIKYHCFIICLAFQPSHRFLFFSTFLSYFP